MGAPVLLRECPIAKGTPHRSVLTAQDMAYTVAVVGATEAVGREMIKTQPAAESVLRPGASHSATLQPGGDELRPHRVGELCEGKVRPSLRRMRRGARPPEMPQRGASPG